MFYSSVLLFDFAQAPDYLKRYLPGSILNIIATILAALECIDFSNHLLCSLARGGDAIAG